MKRNKILYLSLVIVIFLFSFTSFASRTKAIENTKNYSSVNKMKVYDPLEPMNRRIYYFNYGFDKYVFIPVVNAYKFIAPDVVQKGIRNFSNNNKMITTATNSLMQGKVKKAMRAVGRFTMNGTVGLAGTIDVASSMGMPVPHEDFGLTLAYYGVRRGPYLMLPILGPSNLRDTLGKAVDSLNPIFLDPYEAIGFMEISSAPVTIVTSVDARSTLDFRYYSSGSPFEYEYLRFLFIKYRDIQEKASKKPDIIHIRKKESN